MNRTRKGKTYKSWRTDRNKTIPYSTLTRWARIEEKRLQQDPPSHSAAEIPHYSSEETESDMDNNDEEDPMLHAHESDYQVEQNEQESDDQVEQNEDDRNEENEENQIPDDQVEQNEDDQNPGDQVEQTEDDQNPDEQVEENEDDQNPDEQVEENEDDQNPDDQVEQNEEEAIMNSNVALVCAFIAKHHCTASLTNDLLKMLNVIAPGILPKSRYYLFKYVDDSLYKRHYICNNCQSYLGINLREICDQCKTAINMEQLEIDYSYILTLDLAHSITTLCLYTDFLNIIKVGKQQQILPGIQSGKMYYQYENFVKSSEYNITLSFGLDGGNVFKSRSALGLWPLFFVVNEIPPELQSKFMMLHTIWYGKKPNPKAYFKVICDELNELQQNGLQLTLQDGNVITLKAQVLMGIMDAPARAHFQRIKQFNGKFGCGYCEIEGEIREGQVKYPANTLAQLRSHESVLHCARQAEIQGEAVKGVKGFSPLGQFPSFDLVYGCPPDAMHAVYHGVVRKVVFAWFDSSFQRVATCKYPEFDQHLLSLKPPSSVTRRPRTVKERADFKAAEWKNFVMYYCVFVLRQTALPQNYVRHFFLLSYAVHILNAENVGKVLLRKANIALTKFIEGIERLYGPTFSTYNVHILSHLVKFYKLWGPIWAYNAFRFEDAIRRINKYHHGANKVNLQTMKHYLLHQAVQSMCKIEQADDARQNLYSSFTGSKLKTVKMRGKKSKPLYLTVEEQEAMRDKTIKHEFNRGWVKPALYLACRAYCQTKVHIDSCVKFNKDEQIEFGIVHKMFTDTNDSIFVMVKCINQEVEQDIVYDPDVADNLLSFVKVGKLTNHIEVLNIGHILEKMFCTFENSDDDLTICKFISLTFAEIQ